MAFYRIFISKFKINGIKWQIESLTVLSQIIPLFLPDLGTVLVIFVTVYIGFCAGWWSKKKMAEEKKQEGIKKSKDMIKNG